MGRGLLSAIAFVPRGHCTTWADSALLSCQCNGVLSGALVLYLVHCFVAMKPVTPLRPGLRVWVKPPSPLLGENVGFSGVEGSQWCWGFHWSARGGAQWCHWFQRALMVGAQRRQRFQHRYVAVGCARKSSPCVLNAPQMSPHLPLLGEFFRENTAGARVLGELFRVRGPKCLVPGELRRAHCCRILILGSCVSFRACAAYDAVRTWLVGAIEHVAKQQGVDIENPTWE